MKFDFGSLAKPFEADWPVTVSVPQPGGRVQEQILKMRFRLVPEAELEAMGEGVEPAKTALRRVIVGFGQGETEAFTPELLELLLDRPYVRLALNKGYGEFALGIAAKNSETPPA